MLLYFRGFLQYCIHIYYFFFHCLVIVLIVYTVCLKEMTLIVLPSGTFSPVYIMLYVIVINTYVRYVRGWNVPYKSVEYCNVYFKLKLKLPLAPVIYCYLIMWSMYISYSYSFPLQINTFYKFCFYFNILIISIPVYILCAYL